MICVCINIYENKAKLAASKCRLYENKKNPNNLIQL